MMLIADSRMMLTISSVFVEFGLRGHYGDCERCHMSFWDFSLIIPRPLRSDGALNEDAVTGNKEMSATWKCR